MGDLAFVAYRKKGVRYEYRLASKIGSIWSNIGSRLGIEPDILDCIIDEQRTNEKRLNQVMNRWLSNAGNLPNHEEYPLSWEGLRNLLEDCEKGEVANEFFEFLREESSV